MNTAYLSTLLAVHRCGSMAQAARELNLTHGAVAQQLNALSAQLGKPMVTRAGKTVALTPAAYRILQSAQEILERVDTLTALAHKDQISNRSLKEADFQQVLKNTLDRRLAYIHNPIASPARSSLELVIELRHIRLCGNMYNIHIHDSKNNIYE